jgi:UDP-N-acetylmuramyl pentapeptide phosphotransferase/UDP-N-acetylglucosamine-1-phosphate transferase
MLLGVVVDLIQPELLKLVSLMTAAMVLLIMGVKDDLVFMSPRKKLLGQLFAACIVIFLTDIRILGFGGLLGIWDLPYYVSVLFTLFVYILVINALNLIDGIDGLAGSLTILASSVFGTYFLLAENYLLVLVSFALIGSVIGFLYYNLSNTQKLFMGDSGSMLLGFLLVYQAIGFLEVNADNSAHFTIADAPVMLLAILSYALFDTLRVFSIRVWHKRSPFRADRNHIHHRLLNLGFAHWQTTLLICGANAIIIGLVFLISDVNINLQLAISVFVGSGVYLLPFMMAVKKSIPKQDNKAIDYTMTIIEHRAKDRKDFKLENESSESSSKNERFEPIFNEMDLTRHQRSEKKKDLEAANILKEKKTRIYKKSVVSNE